MSWEDRVGELIYLYSPTAQTFSAKWIENDRSKEKALGIFKYPLARGAVVQDMGMGPVREPITIYFEGSDHDVTAQAFWSACDETGVWRILHPVKGWINRQLVMVTEAIRPVTSGGVTSYECEWIEPDLNNPAVSIAQLEEDVLEQIETTQATLAQQFVDKVRIDKPSFLARLVAAVLKVVAVVNRIRGVIAGITAVITSVVKTVMGIIAAGVMAVNSLASAVMALILLPGQLIKDIKAQFQFFHHVLSTTFTDFEADLKDVYGGSTNTAAVVELVTTGCIVGMAQAVVSADFKTRGEALGYLEQVEAAFLSVVNGLDGVQAQFASVGIDKQYFSNSNAFGDLLELMRRVRELILRRSFDLATAKRLTLRADRAPVEIALTEGVDLDTFIASNGLRGDEILLLPAGRQVVIYG